MKPNLFLTILGHINRDIILRVPKIPEKGSINVLGREECCGGTAYNMAMVASILGIPTNVYSSVGKNLKDYNAIDTGIFLFTPDIFQALEESINEVPFVH